MPSREQLSTIEGELWLDHSVRCYLVGMDVVNWLRWVTLSAAFALFLQTKIHLLRFSLDEAYRWSACVLPPYQSIIH